jgi:outer membrane murein-binding lipoprotein Lpp
MSTPDETTSSGRLRALKLAERPEPVDDLHVAVGQLMASVAKLTTTVSRLDARVAELVPLSAEVTQLRRDVEIDRGDLVHGASTTAARHSSNRLAILMGTLFSLYEVSAPYLREVWRAIHQ